MCWGAQAQATQDANRAATNRMPPAWAIAAMVVLGFNEFLALLYNPLYIVLGLAIFLFARTVYQARLARNRAIVHSGIDGSAGVPGLHRSLTLHGALRVFIFSLLPVYSLH